MNYVQRMEDEANTSGWYYYLYDDTELQTYKIVLQFSIRICLENFPN